MATRGTGVLDFGATPGGNVAFLVVAGQAGILAGSDVEAYLMREATATHNAYEHGVVPIKITCGDIVAGVGFTIMGASDWRLDGTFNVHWVWV